CGAEALALDMRRRLGADLGAPRLAPRQEQRRGGDGGDGDRDRYLARACSGPQPALLRRRRERASPGEASPHAAFEIGCRAVRPPRREHRFHERAIFGVGVHGALLAWRKRILFVAASNASRARRSLEATVPGGSPRVAAASSRVICSSSTSTK